MSITLERHFQTLFGKFVLKEMIFCAYELKISHGSSVNFHCFRDQQLPSLWKTYTEGINIKFTDASLGLKNYDGICYKGPAYVGIMFKIPTNQKEFYLIHIKEVMKIKKSGSKSIKKLDCERLGTKHNFI
jgi:hypothetical protein